MKKQIIYLNILRVIACFLVVVNHTHGYILYYNTFINSTFYCVMFSFCKIAVPIFLMITGVLILDKDYDYKKISKCIHRVFIPLIFISFALYVRDVGINKIDMLNFIIKFLNEPLIIPFWYLYMLIGLYPVIPFLQKMIKNFKNKDYLFFVLVFLLIPSLIKIISIYYKVKIDSHFVMSIFPVSIGIMISGNYLSKIKVLRKYFVISIMVFLVSYSLMFFSMYIPYIHNKGICYVLGSWDSLPVLLMSMSFFYIIRYLFVNNNIYPKGKKILIYISSTTFGIYLIHSFINNFIYKISFIQDLFHYSGIIGIIVLEILTFITSGIIVYLLKLIPYLKKYL